MRKNSIQIKLSTPYIQSICNALPLEQILSGTFDNGFKNRISAASIVRLSDGQMFGVGYNIPRAKDGLCGPPDDGVDGGTFEMLSVVAFSNFCGKDFRFATEFLLVKRTQRRVHEYCFSCRNSTFPPIDDPLLSKGMRYLLSL